MIFGRALLQRLVFGLVSVSIVFLLSFRPIPGLKDANDTGRYVEGFYAYCSGAGFAGDGLSYKIFYAATSLACFPPLGFSFLFVVGLFVPLIFLLFSKWTKGVLWIALGCTLSVYGLEMMTNAMRQGFATLIFCWSLYLSRRNGLLSLGVAGISALAHTSALIYFPLLVWILVRRFSISVKCVLMVLSAMGPVTMFLIAPGLMIQFVGESSDLLKTYAEIYSMHPDALFLLFMVAPLYWVYVVREFAPRGGASEEERLSIIYSSIILSSSYLFFPYITYRFAIFAVVVQLFLVSRVEYRGRGVDVLTFLGLFIHLLAMMLLTDHFDVLFYG